MECLSQMQGGFVDGESVNGRPEIKRIALSCAAGMEAVEDVLLQVDGKAAALRPIGTV